MLRSLKSLRPVKDRKNMAECLEVAQGESMVEGSKAGGLAIHEKY